MEHRHHHVTFVSFATLLTLSGLSIATSQAAHRDLDHSRQCIVVITDDWASTSGALFVFERVDLTTSWKRRGPPFSVVLGKNGLGQGRGMIQLRFEGAPNKKEGDNRAPAGIFRLSSAFGYAPERSVSWIRLPYQMLTNQTEGIDDPRSHYYNKLMDRSKASQVDWRSSERMRRADILYKWGVILDHNPDALPAAGSCIFLHIWKNASTPTTGCTAISESNLLRLLRWFDPDQHPILVQMPRGPYRSIQEEWSLPKIRNKLKINE